MKKAVLPLVAVLILIMAGVSLVQAQPAQVPGPGTGYGFGQARGGPGGGRGPGGGGFSPMAKFREDPEVVQLRTQVLEKRRALQNLFTAETMDEAAVTSLHKEILALNNQIAEKRMAYMVEFKKRNPDWQPQFNRQKARGRGGRGQQAGWRQGQGPGAGWQQGQGPGAGQGRGLQAPQQ